MTLVEKLVASSKSFVEHFSSRGFDDIVLSAKAHDVPTTLAVYRALSKELPQIPLHVGVTEAGALRQGTVRILLRWAFYLRAVLAIPCAFL